MLIPLIYTQNLPPMQWEKLPLLAPAPPAPPQPVTRTPARTVHAIPKIFTAPGSIPRKIALIVDEPAVPISGTGLGVSAGLETASEPVNLASILLDRSVIPPPQPPEQPKPALHAPSVPVHVSGGVQAAKLLRRVVPLYPALAKQARISGTVRLVGVIGEDGTIQNLQVISGHPLLVNAAVEAVRQWLYRPTLLSGEPVEVIAPIDVTFNLN